jgi:tRNA U34 5-methylaminomethyl-2-thiouridine-forming methyltransferase MnmC
MPPHRPRQASGIPGLDWLTTDDGSLTLWDEGLQETYHSGCGAIAESLVVYLINSGAYQRLLDGQSTRIFELGLGTATNLLLTSAAAEYAQCRLEYWAVEKKLLDSTVYQKLDLAQRLKVANSNIVQKFPALPELTERFSSWLARCMSEYDVDSRFANDGLRQTEMGTCFPNLRHLTYGLTEHVEVHLLVGDALDFCIAHTPREMLDRFHCVYFDPFSPDTNPELWTTEVLSTMGRILLPMGSLTSYCVKGDIRRMLQQIGFTVRKVPGPAGGKREVLQAHKSGPPGVSS